MNTTTHITKNKDQEVLAAIKPEDNAKMLSEIMLKLDSIQAEVEQINRQTQQAPQALELITDAIDEVAGQAHESGTPLGDRMEAVLKLMDRLSQPGTLSKLNSLLDLSEQLPQILADAVDLVDQQAAMLEREGIDLSQRTTELITLLKRLTAPKTLQKLNGLMDVLDDSTDYLTLAVDTFDDFINRLSAEGIDISQLADNLQSMLMASHTALTATLNESPKKIGGVLSLLRQLNDKDFQKVLAFMATFGKHFGRELGK